ncbi:unnamed protein product [Amoebophrya sp. A25]|nr:unnamed protein product [Amoebophrya sp. A25]|eukprot:GSA25T00007417001.1
MTNDSRFLTAFGESTNSRFMSTSAAMDRSLASASPQASFTGASSSNTSAENNYYLQSKSLSKSSKKSLSAATSSSTRATTTGAHGASSSVVAHCSGGTTGECELLNQQMSQLCEKRRALLSQKSMTSSMRGLPQPPRQPEGEAASPSQILPTDIESQSGRFFSSAKQTRSSVQGHTSSGHDKEDQELDAGSLQALEAELEKLKKRREAVLKQRSRNSHALTDYVSLIQARWLIFCIIGVLLFLILLFLYECRSLTQHVALLKEGPVEFYAYYSSSGSTARSVTAAGSSPSSTTTMLLKQVKSGWRRWLPMMLYVYGPVILHACSLAILIFTVLFILPPILTGFIMVFRTGEEPDEEALALYISQNEERAAQEFPIIQTAASVYTLTLSLVAFGEESRRHLERSYTNAVPAWEKRQLHRAWREFSMPKSLYMQSKQMESLGHAGHGHHAIVHGHGGHHGHGHGHDDPLNELTVSRVCEDQGRSFGEVSSRFQCAG